MKVIIAEKPSVARELARIVGANNKQEGYIEGNDYAVTWALGHLVTLALPEGYGYKGFNREVLPIIPSVFSLVPRQVKGENGYKSDPGALAQLKVIKKLFASCDSIIVATDAAREGEAIFRYIYEYLGCAKPFDRLWISSLTDKAIREGLANLKCGAEYDNLYYAARSRSQADWLVGINATQAVTIAAGRGTYSLGRVQTPTLAMVCSRYWENRNFTASKFWQMGIGVHQGGEVIKLASVDKWTDKSEADTAYQTVKTCEQATVTSIECKESIQEPPLLYDLTALQKEANSKHGFSADKTLSIAQKLYESKLITYPRTGSRFISEDVFANVPALIASLKSHPDFSRYVKSMGKLNSRCVDDTKITDHHALLITNTKRPYIMEADEATIYNMVAGRMLESFSDRCVKNVTTITAECGGIAFVFKGSITAQAGWRGVYGEDCTEQPVPLWCEGDALSVGGCSISEGTTKPKPLHTEATLLAAMEGAGKEIEDDEARLAMKGSGIGTPATRAAIIETLFTRDYMVRQKKSLVPTEKGLALYSVVKSMRIADVEMTGAWESALAKVESGELRDDTFMKGIEVYAAQVTSELLKSSMLFPAAPDCPKCSTGKMNFYGKVVKCSNPECGLPVFKQMGGKQLSDANIRELLKTGETGIIKGLKSKAGKSFDASLTFDSDFKVVYSFPEKKPKARKPK
ncbi:DNA topoisomerase III [Bacteroides thetaiotaomicron]|uniref:type IA DNA topoisomerase n=1 Tax=Bacteroides thetaiotaomicron TaxID=818 RepID=UPI001C8CA579|nr:type IA DNA topoisomerase [Bacteroides thetaiotaomicron]MBX9049598.1 DNA topoisomerase III [Bacteroides thetaiotaomicron]MBX9074248.1 DNA topoisomerase III [Bacteroides thetaiotaomicron]